MRDCKKLMHKNAKNPKNLDINPLLPWENMGFFLQNFWCASPRNMPFLDPWTKYWWVFLKKILEIKNN